MLGLLLPVKQGMNAIWASYTEVVHAVRNAYMVTINTSPFPLSQVGDGEKLFAIQIHARQGVKPMSAIIFYCALASACELDCTYEPDRNSFPPILHKILSELLFCEF